MVQGDYTDDLFAQSLEVFRAICGIQKPALGQIHESYDALISIVGFRLAHFNCFSGDADTENRKKVEQLKAASKKYIELFIETYKDKAKETFDDLIKQFEFASIEDFDF